MKVDHLINGKAVAGTDYFETVNPATQEVLAEVAAGGEAEVHAAVAAAKAAFPKWANTPATDRARLIRKLGDLIAAHVHRPPHVHDPAAVRGNLRIRDPLEPENIGVAERWPRAGGRRCSRGDEHE